MTLRRHVLWTAPVLLFVTAVSQIALAKFGTLTPWKGGGFGLFATVDRHENRILLAWLETGEGEEALEVSVAGREAQNALAFPTASHLERVGSPLAAGQTRGAAVRVEVWKVTFDPATGAVRRVLVARHRVPRGR